MTKPDPIENNDIEEIPRPFRSKHHSVSGELWAFLRVRKKFWLAPLIITLLLLALLFFIAGTSTTMSPFIYML